MSGGIRATLTTIPNNLWKTIQNIKEITGNHSDDDIYTMLKECSMDPNETAQKLLHQDTFHEVKRRKDRKKENPPNQDIVDSRWKLGTSGRGGRGKHTSRYADHHEIKDAADVKRSTASHKENGVNRAFKRAGPVLSPAASHEAKNKDAGSSVSVMANGPIGVVSGGTKTELIVSVPSESVAKQPEMSSQRQSHIGTGKRSNMAFTKWESRDAPGKVGCKTHGSGKNQVTEVSQPSLPTSGGSSSSRPSSNYGNRLQHGTTAPKVGPNKEWKPKSISAEGQKPLAASYSSNVSSDGCLPAQNTTDSKEASKLHKDLDTLHIKDMQHVIIPNHIHVPEAVRTTLSFGSFDSSFVITCGSTSEPSSETHQRSEAVVEQPDVSQNTLTLADDADYVDNSPPTTQVSHEVSSIDVDSDSKKEIASGLQHSTVETSSTYNFGLMPAVLSTPLGALESSKTQESEVSRVPSLAVQPPPGDPSSFYTGVYRSGSDSDGRISLFPVPGVAAKYNGNIAFLSAQTSQSPPEGGNANDGQPPLTSQPPSMMPTTMAVPQQPMPIFRQPPGVHIPHYPPNYIPYGHYFSPFFVPPPTMHHFLANNAFPQQAQPSGVYPGPPSAAAATAVTFPLSHYKPGSNTRNSAHVGVGGMYGPYGAATSVGNSNANEDLVATRFKESNVYRQQTEGPAIWIPGPGREISSLSGNSFYNIAPQGQHVTFAPTQAGQATFPGIYHPAQAVTAAAVHPLLQQSQAMPGVVDMVGATASVYQPPQHAQMNWPNNF